MALVTKLEIIQESFTRTLAESRIPNAYPEIVEYKYIRPILGDDFYAAVVASPASYTALLVYVKPIICWYAKYMVLPELRVELSDLGVNTMNVNGATPLTDEGFAAIRDQTLLVAEEKVRMLNDYLYNNYTLYPLYFKSLNSSENVQIRGGIVMKKKRDNDEFSSNDYFIDK
jgi:hypothetical protein